MIGEIRAAAERIRDRVTRTRCVEVPESVHGRGDMRLYLKLECTQRGGAFKARGAAHFIARQLDGGTRPAGVITYSSGNHGRAVAEAARDVGLPAVVVAPENIDGSKAVAIQAAGAELVRAGRTSASRREAAERIAAERGYAMVPPFDHEWIIAGQGTIGLELLDEFPALEGVWVPVGGGGLAAGVAAALRGSACNASIYCVEPQGAAALAESLRVGKRVALARAESVADGLLPLSIGERNWEILSQSHVKSVEVEEAVIIAALRCLRTRLGVAAEPSGAVAAAPLLFPAECPAGRAALPGVHVAVVSGGNISEERLEELLR